MLTDEQINDIVQENVWCVEDKTRIIYTISILKQQNKQLIEALKEIGAKCEPPASRIANETLWQN